MGLSGWSALLFGVVVSLLVISLAAAAWKAMVFHVEEGWMAVVTRGGKFIRDVGPGLHAHFPIIGGARKVPHAVQTMQVRISAGTFDAVVVVRYRIERSYERAWLTLYRDPQQQLQAMVEGVLTREVATAPYERALDAINSSFTEIEDRLRDFHDAGVRVDDTEVMSLTPHSSIVEVLRRRETAALEAVAKMTEAQAGAERAAVAAKAEAARLAVQSQAERDAADAMIQTVNKLVAELGIRPDAAVKLVEFYSYLETVRAAQPTTVALPAPNADFANVG